jgi:hypothetical protein
LLNSFLKSVLFLQWAAWAKGIFLCGNKKRTFLASEYREIRKSSSAKFPNVVSIAITLSKWVTKFPHAVQMCVLATALYFSVFYIILQPDLAAFQVLISSGLNFPFVTINDIKDEGLRYISFRRRLGLIRFHFARNFHKINQSQTINLTLTTL